MTDTEVTVGQLHSATGSMAISETGSIQAERLAIDQINAMGGFLGRKIKIVQEDGASAVPAGLVGDAHCACICTTGWCSCCGPICRNSAFTCRAGQGEQAFTLYRAAATHATAHLAYSHHRFERRSLKPVQLVLISLLVGARLEQLAIDACPRLLRLWLQCFPPLPRRDDSYAALALRLSRALLDPTYEAGNPWIAKGEAAVCRVAGKRRRPRRVCRCRHRTARRHPARRPGFHARPA